MKKISLFILMLMMVVIATACSTEAEESTTDVATNSNPSDANEAEEISESDESDVPTEITITHELGDTVVTTNPEKVVVFDYGFLDILDYAGLSESIIGLPKSNTLPDYLSHYSSDQYENVGSLKEADFEKLFELQPDVILISARMSPAYEELSNIAPTVYLPMPGGTYLETMEENLETFASIFTDQSEQLTKKFADIQATAEDIQATVKDNDYTGLVIQTNDATLSVFGFGSRYATVYTDLGFILTDESIEQSTHGQSASFEYLAEQNPDYLFVIDRSAAVGTGEETGAQELLDNELVNQMDASKNDTITYLNATNWYIVSGGITSTSMMLDEVADAINN